MQSPAPAPTAQGVFAKTPLPHLLVYALERRLSGTFELSVNGESVATMLVVTGFPAKLRTKEGVHYLGEVMAELGLITEEQLRASQDRMQESPRLQGQILKELGAVDDARLDVGVRAQLERKLDHLFSLPAETLYAYYDGVDALQRYGGPPTPIDPLPALWRGVRQSPAWEHVDATLRRVGGAAVRLSPAAQIERLQLTPAELQTAELLRKRPARVVDLAGAKIVGPSVAQLLVYCLVITKQVDLVETASMRPPGQAPAIPPPPQTPATAQAFARVQLQAKPVARAPLIVEEMPATTSASDNRIASPMPQPIPLPPEVRAATAGLVGPGGAMDIGAMISSTIQSSMPPPMPEPPPESVPVPAAPPSSPQSGSIPAARSSGSLPAARSSGSIPAAPASAPSSGAALTSEQNALKMKILERADQIGSQDYFQMLGVERDAPVPVVQKAFVALAKVWHPDRLPAALVDVKDACSKVFSLLTEAHATLTDADRRAEYMTLMKDGGATPEDQAKIQAILEAATDFQKAEFHLKRNDTAQAYELAAKAYELDPEQADYLAMVTWLEAQRPEWTGREKTLEKIAVLDRCVKKNTNCERAYFWRGMLYKRIDEGAKAVKDFKKAAELNPRNLDAMREVRLHVMRGGTKPPPGISGARTSKPPQPETLGGLFGKLFKK